MLFCKDRQSHRTVLPSSHENVMVHDMHMDGMSMHDMNMDDMEMGDTSIDHHAMEDMVSGAATVDVSIRFSRLAFGEEAVANKFDQPVESCAHCLAHSSIFSAPISTVSVSDQSNKDPGAIPLSVSRSLARPAMRLAQIGRPREHAPPGNSAPRHILINVFLI